MEVLEHFDTQNVEPKNHYEYLVILTQKFMHKNLI